MSPARTIPISCLLLATLLTAAVYCEVPYGTPFDLAVGASVEVGDEGLLMGFTGILSDSRCPIGAVCVWEGDAEAALWIEVPGRPREDFVLHTSAMFVQSRDVGCAVIHLLSVTPHPTLDGPPIDPADYVVQLLVVCSGPIETEPHTWGTTKAVFR